MKNIIFLILVTATHVCQSQADTIWYNQQWQICVRDSAAFFRPVPPKVNSGYYIVDYYLNGQKQCEGFSYTLNNEKWNGPVKYYYENGKPKALALYKDSVMDGEQLQFYSDGTIAASLFMKSGKYEGRQLFYNRNGKLKSENNYKGGKANGDFLRYSLFSGKISERVTYVNDKAEGESLAFNDDGRVIARAYFKNNLLEGAVTQYYGDGQIKLKANYLAGKKQGLYTTYYENGNLQSTQTYVRDTLNGLSVKYGYYGQKMEEGTYKAGKQTGTWKFYDEAGNLAYTIPGNLPAKVEQLYKRVVAITGTVPVFTDTCLIIRYDNGKTALRGCYKKGKPEGRWVYLDKQDNILLREYYESGKLEGEREFYQNGKLQLSLYYNNGLLNGGAYEKDSITGKTIYTTYFKKGVEVFSDSEVSGEEQIEEPAVAAAVVEESVATEPLKIDTLKTNRGLEMQAVLSAADVYNANTLDPINVHVFFSADTTYLLQQFNANHAGDNELLFYYNDNRETFRQPLLLFKPGKNVAQQLQGYSPFKYDIIVWLRDSFFQDQDFPGPLAGEALEATLQ